MMHIVKTDQGKTIKVWAKNLDDMEAKVMEQMQDITRLPCVYGETALMPDGHLGIDAAIGAVIPTIGAVIPGAVGVDIGCGMSAAKLSHTADQLVVSLEEIYSMWKAAIPVGHMGYNQPQMGVAFHSLFGDKTIAFEKPEMREKALCQVGSLGGGNHFVELCTGADGSLWIMLHTGSRAVGNITAGLHAIAAKGYMKDLFNPENANQEDMPKIAYLVEGSPQFESYWHDLQWCQTYARLSRYVIMEKILDMMAIVLGKPKVIPTFSVDCHHNYAEKEIHAGKEMIITRKGAVRARRGDFGIIPGAMGRKSFIVAGKGNIESFCSCSHGAGRIMSRTEAVRRFTIEDVIKQTEGLVCAKDLSVVDELGDAYKPIEEVMDAQADLVTKLDVLTALITLKGPKDEKKYKKKFKKEKAHEFHNEKASEIAASSKD